LVLNGIQITTYGYFPAEDLIGIAESLAPR
jgi:hypothetical protein